MAATEVWDSQSGYKRRAPAAFCVPRQEYIRATPERLAPRIHARQTAEPPAGSDLAQRLTAYFNERVAVQTPIVRRRINAKLALLVTRPHGEAWTVALTASGPEYVTEGLAPHWAYKV